MTTHAAAAEALRMADPKKRRKTMPRAANLAPAAIATPTVEEKLVPDDHVVVLFGGTGDLARRKLLPGPRQLRTSASRASATTCDGIAS